MHTERRAPRASTDHDEPRKNPMKKFVTVGAPALTAVTLAARSAAEEPDRYSEQGK
jgi:hypothetical protein